jgi:sulfide:quinone oxidoreductase
MSRVVILGAGISGHTAAAFARRWLDRDDIVTVVSPNDSYNWIPSNIWVGVGLMGPGQVTFPLAPVYERHGIEFKQAWAREIHPEGDTDSTVPYVVTESASGTTEKVRYDFLTNATGPRLRFDKTEGLDPEHNSLSVCTPEHAVQASAALDEAVGRMRRGAAAGSPAKVTAETARYVTRPTRLTLFLRTFIPWQLWRFARINLKMIRIIRRSHR